MCVGRDEQVCILNIDLFLVEESFLRNPRLFDRKNRDAKFLQFLLEIWLVQRTVHQDAADVVDVREDDFHQQVDGFEVVVRELLGQFELERAVHDVRFDRTEFVSEDEDLVSDCDFLHESLFDERAVVLSELEAFEQVQAFFLEAQLESAMSHKVVMVLGFFRMIYLGFDSRV